MIESPNRLMLIRGSYLSGFYIQKPKSFTAFRRDKRLRSAPLCFVVEALLHFKQAVVLLRVGHEFSSFIAVYVFPLKQEPDELSFFDFELLSGFTEVCE